MPLDDHLKGKGTRNQLYTTELTSAIKGLEAMLGCDKKSGDSSNHLDDQIGDEVKATLAWLITAGNGKSELKKRATPG